MTKCGGHSDSKPITDELHELALSMKANAESELKEEFSKFEATHYRSQVVAGMIYHFRVLIHNKEDDDDDGDVVHMKVLKPLPHTGESPNIMKIQKMKAKDPLELL
eukprot:CAMPEP_0194184068 /NCGR_PEP_ID=MMETSP0154-20130528/35664_1 /TAXON_ID=1049557 /ORGANISM="Thalassiothrix antarctica, Strain L6-D1" /LENGTH=105 /DNA_ID=CAMNT_0038901451 /DNA_START=11 /DNA_END=328 /DNA_ORIENTATION=+